MVKTYFKTVRRMFRHHLIRLFSLIGIILISVGFTLLCNRLMAREIRRGDMVEAMKANE